MDKKDYQEILDIIKPGKDEIKKITLLSSSIISIINDSAIEKGIDAQAVLVGSVAKKTWLSGSADVDIFIKFPLDTSNESLKKEGLFLGKKCIHDLKGSFEYRYASHPYITGLIDGLDIDFVPCYDLRGNTKIKSAVDRTIPHTEYVIKYLKPKERDEVLLLKCFMKTIDTYGSDFKVGGFAGYLCELLIIHYKTFLKVLESAACDWKPGYKIDLAGYGTAAKFTDLLIVVDPVDPQRNVAAALTPQKISQFIAASRNFLNKPNPAFFQTRIIKPDLNQIRERFKNRGTRTFILSFNAPYIPADALYPQIKKTADSIFGLVERNGFKLYDRGSWTDEKSKVFILLEFEIWKLPRLKKHIGPPIWSPKHDSKFLEKYKDQAWLEEDRWVAEVHREYIQAQDLINAALTREEISLLKFGKHIKNNILEEYELIDIGEIFKEELDPGFKEFLYFYLNKSRKYILN